jgi:uncharacterized RDD family membrane protein YckC
MATMASSMAVSTAGMRESRPRQRREPQLTYASFEARVVAATLDLLVLFIIGALLVTVGSVIVLVSSEFEKTDPSTLSINAFWVCVGSIAPATLMYFFMSYAWKGQTVGQAVMQLMVIRSNGHPLGVLGAAARVIGLLAYVLLFALGCIGAFVLRDRVLAAGIAIGVGVLLCVVGVVIAAFDSHRRMLHDRLAGTIVVRLQ